MQYQFSRFVNPERLLAAMGRGDIDSARVSVHVRGNTLVVDFADIPLSASDEEKLKEALATFGYSHVRQGPQVLEELTEERPRPTRSGVAPVE